MKFNAALPILSSLVVLARAFKPEADGVYEVTINSDGKIIDGELVGNVTSTGALERRDIPDPATRCLGYGINGNDYVVAFNSINRCYPRTSPLFIGSTLTCLVGATLVTASPLGKALSPNMVLVQPSSATCKISPVYVVSNRP
jgi:hypothetical protein